MSRRKRIWSFHTYCRYLQNGRGSGDLESYKPWITVHDFPSKGKVARILGKKTHRIHHLLSQLEKIYFLLLDNDPEVEDIKEQYPIPLEFSQMIAAELGIKHPVVNGFSYVMTTDFMIKRNGVWEAVQIKTEEDLEQKRVQEKFAIEEAYYKKIGVAWKTVTEKKLPEVAGWNYYWLNSGEPIEKLIPNSGMLKRMQEAFLSMYQDYTIPFQTIISGMDNMCQLKKGTTMQLFKKCIMDNCIDLDLCTNIDLTEPRDFDKCIDKIYGGEA